MKLYCMSDIHGCLEEFEEAGDWLILPYEEEK